jgi:deoxycytidylate deaminase
MTQSTGRREYRKVYDRAKFLALGNGRTYHIAAILKRNGRIVKIGENTDKTHPRFKRQYEDGTWASHMHAEMNVLRFSQPGDEIEVIRFKKIDHTVSMAKPCDLCMKEMKKSGIKTVRYTNWSGNWEVVHLY